jgi:hypothetical protein
LAEEIFNSRLFWFVIGAVLVLLTVSVKTHVADKNTKKKLLLESVTAERSKWRESLREDVAAFNALASEYYYTVCDLDNEQADKLFAAHIQELIRLRVRVRLRLNPNELIHSNDVKLVRAMSRIILQFETKQYDGLHHELLRIERCAQRILKHEWDKAKREAVTGKMEKVPVHGTRHKH